MNAMIYLLVRLLSAIYILYRLWRILRYQKSGFWDRLFSPHGLSDPHIPTTAEATPENVVGQTLTVYLEAPQQVEDEHSEAASEAADTSPATSPAVDKTVDPKASQKSEAKDDKAAVSETQTEDTGNEAPPVPVRSEPLERSDFIGEEEEISSDDVEAHLLPPEEQALTEEERFEPLPGIDPAPDPEFSSGLTFEQMSNAVGVITEAVDDEQKVIEAAKTIYNIRHTDLFQFFTTEAGSAAMVEQLFAECLDSEGQPLPYRRRKQTIPDGPFDWSKYI